MSGHYEQDFYQWTQEQTRLLRSGRLAELDVEHLAEEIEAMGISDRRELESRMKVLLAHLLKWEFQPEQRSSGWQGTLDEQRDQLEILLRQSPSLQRFLAEALAHGYPKARRAAARETGLPLARFPEGCPYSPAQALDPDFLPGPQN